MTSVARDSQNWLVHRLTFEIVRHPIEGGVQTRCPSSRGRHTVFGGHGNDPGAYALAVQGDKDAEAGHLGLAIHSYRKAIARAPWWADARRNLAGLYDAAGMATMASAERAFADRLGK